MINILFDIGGTKMRLASSDGEKILKTIILDTPGGFDEGVQLFRKMASDVSGGETIGQTAGGLPGTFDRDKKTLLRAPHLPAWAGKPVKEEFSRALGAPVFLENDAALAALGEAAYGAGKEQNVVAYLTVSTGVGGARVDRGEIDAVSLGFEPGHQILDPDKTLCPSCPGNTLEDYISGTSLEKRFGKKPKEISDPAVWDELARFLAYGLNNICVHWSPDIIVLGGSMILGDPAISIQKTAEYLSGIMNNLPNPPIAKASLGDSAGLWGALQYLKQQK